MSNFDDRISELPQPMLEHVLYFLPQKDAVKTCALSKSWRQLWSNRPNIEFRESFFDGNYNNFMCGLEQTLQRYHDQKLYVQIFILEMCEVDYETQLLLEKWIPGISDIKTFKNLRTLCLTRVHIQDQILEKIISSCPLIEFMSFHVCPRLKTIKANKLRYLKSFEFSGYEDYCNIEIDNPTVETISIESGFICLHHSMHFSNLTSLKLRGVSLSSDSFGFFSRNCPNLKDLAIVECNGFNELCISSGSIKNLILCVFLGPKLKKVIIDAPNIVKFEYEGALPQSFSCTTSNSREWKSHVTPAYDSLIGLHEFLKELSQAVISLDLRSEWIFYEPLALELPHVEPVVVEHLELNWISEDTRVQSVFISSLFHICRPRFVGGKWDKSDQWGMEHKLSQFQCYILMMERKGKKSLPWQQVLDEVRMEKFDRNRQVWHIVHWRGLSRTALRRRDFGPRIRLVLKWRNGDRSQASNLVGPGY